MWIDILAGFCSGMAATLVSHPLDTIKIRIQLGTGDPRLISIFTEIYSYEGVWVQIFIYVLYSSEDSLRVYFHP